jgi:hypothetical protein
MVQVLEVQEALDAQKEEFERREELFRQREEQVSHVSRESAACMRLSCNTFAAS